jgi:hypothetical protein
MASQIGDNVTKTFNFVDSAGDPADPDEVQVIHRAPDLTETVYEFGVDSEVTNPAVGQFDITLRLTTYRRHHFRAIGTGTIDDARPEVFEDVEESFFLDPLP